MGQGDFEQEGLLSLSSHSLLYKQEVGGGMVWHHPPQIAIDSVGLEERTRLRLAYGGRALGTGGMSFTQLGLPSARFVHLAPAGFPALPHNQPDSFFCCCHGNWLPSCTQGTISYLNFPMGFLEDG